MTATGKLLATGLQGGSADQNLHRSSSGLPWRNSGIRRLAPSPAHELAAMDAAMADEEAPMAPVVPKKKSGGRLPTGWYWDEARGLYVNATTLETTVDRPYDRCGTFGCILKDKQCIRGIEPPARTNRVLTACLVLGA